MRQSVLTNEAILKAHAILMHGAVDEYGKQVLAGTYRNHPSHNGAGFVYVEPNDIPRRMRDNVNNIAIGSDEEDVLVVCHATARFVHAFLITHPFQNGNGRMARLIASYLLLQKAGAPFIVPITNGHRKNRQHYLRALRAADRGQYTQLVLYILECYARVCDNAINTL
jgi:Fic family protein